MFYGRAKGRYRLEDLRSKVNARMIKPLAEVSSDLQQVVQLLRATAQDLRPPTLSAFGLEKAIRSHVQDFQERFPKIAVEMALAQDRQLLPEEVRLVHESGIDGHGEASRRRVHDQADLPILHLQPGREKAAIRIPRLEVTVADDRAGRNARAAEARPLISAMLAGMDDPLMIRPAAGPVRGRVRPPGSKSLTNRALVVAASDEAVRDGRIRDNHLLLFEALGGGLAWASALVRW